MAGGTSGGSSGGSSGGVAGGSAGGASGGSAGPVYAQLARFQNSRFVGIAGVGLAGAPSAVGTLRTDGGSSLYESWASDGGIVDRVDAGLSTGLAIASNRTTRAIASRFGGAISATTYAPPLAVTNGVSLGVGEVRRLQVLEGAPDRVAALTQDLNMGVLQVLDPGYGTAPISGTALTLDELIEVTDNGPLRYLVTMRCLSCQVGTLVASNPTRAHYWAAFESNGAGGITPLWLSPTIPGGGTVTISSPVRVARDGFTYLYLAGQQPGGSLAIERRFAADGGVASTPTSMPLATSVAPLTFADMIRGPGGPNVLVLAKAPNPTTFAGQPVGGASTNNIVVLAGSANGYSATTLDVSGDQNPVAFAHGGDGWLYIILNEGPDTVLWRVPVPLPP